MFNRPTYVNAIMKFVDAPLVKVLTGIRRSGKSTSMTGLCNANQAQGLQCLNHLRR